jgi:hypothetical protein
VVFHKFKLSEQDQRFNFLSDSLSSICSKPSFSAGVLLEQLCSLRKAEFAVRSVTLRHFSG